MASVVPIVSIFAGATVVQKQIATIRLKVTYGKGSYEVSSDLVICYTE